MVTREDVLGMARRYWRERPEVPFEPGRSYIPASGKVVDEEDLAFLVDASLDMWLTSGRYAERFSRDLARFVGVRSALLTVSGSAANLLAFAALTSPQLGDDRLVPGDEVITVAAGFPTTVNPIIQNGCVPVFVDIDLSTHNIRVDQLEEGLSARTRAVMIAHTLGNPFDVAAVQAFCRAHDLYLIEDCCDALGATYDGKRVGTFGTTSTLSFYPAHHITMGEGGAVLTQEPKLSKIIESFRDWGRDCWCAPGKDNTCGKRFDWELGDLPAGYDHKYIYSHVGYNLKITDMQAAVGVGQLGKVDQFIARRRENHAYLRKAFVARGLDRDFILPEATAHSEPSWFGFVLTIRPESPLERATLTRNLEEHRIGSRMIFAGNLTRQPAYAGVNYRVAAALTNSDTAMTRSFWIGCWPGLSRNMLDYVVDVFCRVVQEPSK